MNLKQLLKKTVPRFALALLAIGLAVTAHGQAANYAFTQSTTGTYTPVSGGTTVAKASPTATTGILDDVSFAITIPFSFTFNGVSTTSAFVNTNGLLSFGTTSPGPGFAVYSAIASTATASGIVAPFNADLDGVFRTTVSTTSGTNTLSSAVSTAGVSVGDTITGTGIPANTAVTAVTSTSITISNNATATATAVSVVVYSGAITTQTIGTSPNRTFIIQWSNFSPYFTNNNAANFQIRLAEGGGTASAQTVSIVYGLFSFASSGTVQVGLRGSSNTDYNIRTGTGSWTSTTAGTSNSATKSYSSTALPASGLTYTFTPPNVCSGTPTTGTLGASTALACSNAAFTLSLTGGPSGVSGLTYQVQSAPTGTTTFTTIGTALPYTVTSQTAATDYRVIITCTGASTSATSNVLTVGQNVPTGCYCASSANNTSDEEILNVSVGTYSNSSTCSTTAPGTGSILNRYSNYRSVTTAPPAILTGLSSSFSVQVGTCGGNFSSAIAIYIDYNQDGDFTDAGEQVYVSPSSTTGAYTATGSFTAPVTATLGTTVMRVVNVETGTPSSITPCGTYGYGETEDYNISITAPPACSGTPTTGTLASSGAASVCQTTSFVLNTTGGTTGVAGLTYQVQSAPTGTGTFSTIGTTLPYTMTGQLAATDYRVIVTCSTSTLSATSNVVTISQNPATSCYCIPSSSCTSGDNIDTFRLTGSQFTVINDLGTGCAGGTTTPGYDNRTAQTAVRLAQSTIHTGTISSAFGSGENAKVWIDFNDDGFFTSTDSVGIVSSVANAQTPFSIAIPATATLGNHRMRVRLVYNTAAGLIDPCATYSFGETHDYTVQIVSCPPPTVNLGKDTFLCSGSTFTLTTAGAGSSTYQYSNGVSTQSNTVSAAGTYRVVVTTVAGCIGRDTVVLTAATTPTVNLGADTTVCPGQSITLNAGNTGASFLFSNAATTQTTSITAGGTFNVRVTTVQGCVRRDTIVIAQGVTPVVNLGADTAICPGATITLNAGNAGSTFAFSNAATTQTTAITTAGTYSVAVTNAGRCVGRDTIVVSAGSTPIVALGADTTLCPAQTITLDAGNAGSTFAFSNAATTQTTAITSAGTYSVAVTNAQRCVGRDTIVIGAGTDPVVNLGMDTFFCPGNTYTLDAGNTGSTFLYSNSATTQTIIVGAAGQYSVAVTNAQGCIGRDTITFLPGASNPAVFLGNDTTICPGATITLDAGNTGASYLYSNNVTTRTNAITTSGTYSVRVTNAQGCIGRDTIVLNQGVLPIVNLGADTVLCPGQSITLNAGNTGSTFLYNTGATTQSTNVTTGGTYSVAVTNAARCVGRDTIVITPGTNPTVFLGNDTTLCPGASFTLNAGNAGSTFAFSNGATTQTTTINASGTYRVAVTNAQRCVGRDTITVFAGSNPVVALGADTAVCPGATITLNAGNTGSTFLYSTGATTQSINVTSGGTYTVAVTNSTRCVGRDTIIVSQGVTPTVNLGRDTFLCPGASYTLDAGNAGSTFLFSNAVTTQTTTVTTAGTYSVAVTNTAKCVGRDTVVVGTGTNPVVNLGPDTTICEGVAYVLNAGNAGSRFLFSNGATTQTTTISAAGTYNVLVFNAQGCAGSDAVAITTRPAPIASAVTATRTGASVAFTSDAQNATSYIWSFGDGTSSTSAAPTHVYTSNGTYTVVVFAANACGFDTAMTTVTITSAAVGGGPAIGAELAMYPNPASSSIILDYKTTAVRMKSATILSATGAVVLAKEDITSNRETLDISNLPAGTYMVRIMTDKGAILRRLSVVK